MVKKENKKWVVLGSELSPFTLKVMALCDFAGLAYRFLPEEGTLAENIRFYCRKELLIRGLLKLTWPQLTKLDEFPLVPYLFGPNGENLYDSSSIAAWLDFYSPVKGKYPPFLPEDNPAINFVIRLIDEYADEFGLYMAHHFRWKVAAKDNDAGRRLARELRTFLNVGRFFGRGQPFLARWFSARQIRRLPYLFSVAPKGYQIEGLEKYQQPPSHLDFPPTHALLEDSFNRQLAAVETILQKRPYLLGNRFTLADASIYGQLGMNLSDPQAALWIQKKAPTVYLWLKRIMRHDFSPSQPKGELVLDETITPLIEEICRIYIPLMQQNLMAYQDFCKKGEKIFNERAFWKNRAIYKGELDGSPYCSVVKTFQVKTWLEVQRCWSELDNTSRQKIQAVQKVMTPHSLPS